VSKMKGWIALMAFDKKRDAWMEIDHWHEHPKQKWVDEVVARNRDDCYGFTVVRVLPYPRISLLHSGES
jgi:hypothetical protein